MQHILTQFQTFPEDLRSLGIALKEMIAQQYPKSIEIMQPFEKGGFQFVFSINDRATAAFIIVQISHEDVKLLYPLQYLPNDEAEWTTVLNTMREVVVVPEEFPRDYFYELTDQAFANAFVENRP